MISEVVEGRQILRRNDSKIRSYLERSRVMNRAMEMFQRKHSDVNWDYYDLVFTIVPKTEYLQLRLENIQIESPTDKGSEE